MELIKLTITERVSDKIVGEFFTDFIPIVGDVIKFTTTDDKTERYATVLSRFIDYHCTGTVERIDVEIDD